MDPIITRVIHECYCTPKQVNIRVYLQSCNIGRPSLCVNVRFLLSTTLHIETINIHVRAMTTELLRTLGSKAPLFSVERKSPLSMSA